MATYAQLLSIADIKDSGFIDENVDEKICARLIFTTQDEWVQNVLGSSLYDEICAQKIAGTLTALNSTLIGLKYFKRGLMFATIYEGMDLFNYKIRNKAVMKSNSENAQPVDSAELTRLASWFRDKAQWNFEQLRLYLVENESSYPLYYNPGNGVNVIYPQKNTYDSGWVMDSDSDDCCPNTRGSQFNDIQL